MGDIERRLREIDRAAVFPATPDVVAVVVDRVASAPRRDRPGRRWSSTLRPRPAVAVLLALVVAAGALLAASPGARSAILELFGIEGVRIERGETGAARPAQPALGREVSLAEARRATDFELALPRLRWLGPPSRIGLDRGAAPGGQVALLWEPRRGGTDGADATPVVLTQVRATAVPLMRKTAPEGTLVERVEVGGRPGYWLAGAPHRVELLAPRSGARLGTARLARDTLLWEHGQLLLRLEGVGSKARALEIARSIP